MEFPSQDLRQQLSALGLTIPVDLKRSAGTVRRLARGLPVTDSVWIDALVTRRLLTPYQARALEDGQFSELIQGGKYVLQAPRILHPVLNVSEAREGGIKSKVLLSRLRTGATEAEETLARLNHTLRNLAPCRDRIPGLPTDLFYDHRQLCLVAPFQPGEPLSTLLVRRGRFPEAVVRSLALELVSQLHTAEPYALHGDLRLGNLWLCRNGELILLNWGLLNSLSPVITIHTPLPEDAGDTLAPERIESQRRALVTSEIYALGCILWQLLAGRPAFTLADPLAKLTAHRTKTIPDVRTISPETSESLALLIRNMTARDPSRRIQTFAELRQQLTGQGASRSRLQQFSRSFESAAPVQRIDLPKRRRPSRLPAMTACVMLTLVLVGVAWQRDAIGLPKLSSAEATTQVLTPREFKTAEHQPKPFQTTDSAFQRTTPTQSPPSVVNPLPGIDGNKIVLKSNEHYVAGSIATVDELIITTDPNQPATIYIKDQPLSLTAKSVRLEHVRLIVEPSSNLDGESFIQIHSDTLVINHCWGRTRGEPHQNAEGPAFISWTTNTAPGTGRLLVRDSEFLLQQDFIHVAGSITAALLENVQTEGARSQLRLTEGARSGLRVPVMFNACTLRNCGPLVTLPTGDRLQQSGLISIQGADSLVDLMLGEGLVEFQGTEPAEQWTAHVELAAQGLVAPTELVFAILKNTATQQVDELDAENMTIGGLLSGRYQFVKTPNDPSSRDRLQIDALPVRFSPRDPGADPARLPVRPAAL